MPEAGTQNGGPRTPTGTGPPHGGHVVLPGLQQGWARPASTRLGTSMEHRNTSPECGVSLPVGLRCCERPTGPPELGTECSPTKSVSDKAALFIVGMELSLWWLPLTNNNHRCNGCREERHTDGKKRIDTVYQELFSTQRPQCREETHRVGRC